jgi:SAM-dependent methyltransferase
MPAEPADLHDLVHPSKDYPAEAGTLRRLAGREGGTLLTFDLGRRFDAVTCLFSAIGHVADLAGGVANLARHVAPGGLLAVEPWLSPGRVEPGRITLRTAADEVAHVARMNSIEVRDRLSVLDFHYLVGRDGVVEHGTAVHELWLWTPDENAAAFRRAGLRPSPDAAGLDGRGPWLAEVPAPAMAGSAPGE